MKSDTRVTISLTPLMKRAIGHFAVEHDVYQQTAIFSLIVLGLQRHIEECGLDCILVTQMSDVINEQARKASLQLAEPSS